MKKDMFGFGGGAADDGSMEPTFLERPPAMTFEDYCRERWGMARNYANKIISAAAIADNLGTTVPISERQLRPLTQLEPEKQKEVWAEAGSPAGGRLVTMVNKWNYFLAFFAKPVQNGKRKFENIGRRLIGVLARKLRQVAFFINSNNIRRFIEQF